MDDDQRRVSGERGQLGEDALLPRDGGAPELDDDDAAHVEYALFSRT